MQTFLPYRSFEKSARVLDFRRLGKQRVEAKQIHTIIVGDSEKQGWQNHPAVNMWRGYARELAGYHNAIIKEWIARQYKNNMPLIRPAIYEAPSWVTKKLILSHRSNLLRKDYEFYIQYNWKIEDNLPYIWPTNANGD